MRTGTAEQAIDYACFHIKDSKGAIDFLRWWSSTTSDYHFEAAYPSFKEWVEKKAKSPGFTDRHGCHVTEGDRVKNADTNGVITGKVYDIQPDGGCEVVWDYQQERTTEKWGNLVKYRG